MIVKASAPGKIIIAGEHFVVHGGKALALAINRHIEVTITQTSLEHVVVNFINTRQMAILNKEKKWLTPLPVSVVKPIEKIVDDISEHVKIPNIKLDIKSNFPFSAGLGSSAALAAAISAGISSYVGLDIDKKDLTKLALSAESITHNTPSGLDPATVVFGGLILFDGSKKKILDHNEIDLSIIIGDTLKRRNTGELIGNVSKIKATYPKLFSQLIKINDALVENIRNALLNNNFIEAGHLFNISHGLLNSIGTSNLDIESLISHARKNGAYGAKLTGAGGGGCIIALAPYKISKEINLGFEKIGGNGFLARPDLNGVTLLIEK